MTKMMPKPQIFKKGKDAYCIIAGALAGSLCCSNTLKLGCKLSILGQHFNRLHEKYGTPVHVVNLVKRKEKYKSRHEAILAEIFEYQIRNLNRFLAEDEAIRYSRIDMARVRKNRGRGIMDDLDEIAEASLKATGIFSNFVPDLEGVQKESPLYELAKVMQERVREKNLTHTDNGWWQRHRLFIYVHFCLVSPSGEETRASVSQAAPDWPRQDKLR